MRKVWRKVSLREVLRQRKEFITIDDLQIYRRPKVQLHARGIVLRDEVAGAQIKTKSQQVCRAGEFLVAEIDAKVGGFGIVPEILDGSIVSSHYFLFVLDGSKLDRRFLDYFIRTPAFREQVEAQGSTNYAAIRPAHVLGYEIPLPPLDEQLRIVERIEELVAKIVEARTLRCQAAEEAENLLIGLAHRLDLTELQKRNAGWIKCALGDYISLVNDSHCVALDRFYPNLGIYSFGRGLFHKPPIDGASTSAATLYRVSNGQFIYSRLFAFEGAYGMVTSEFDGCFVSNEYPTFNCNADFVLAEFLWAYFKAPPVWKTVATGSKGLGDRRQRVQAERILEHQVWLPPIEEQLKLAQLTVELHSLKHSQTKTADSLNALLPAILDRTFREL
jgi:type I restriction enzyme S subunit